jgi:predicted HTH transcriptional regulator
MPNENLVLNLIKDNSDITISDIVIKTGLSRPTINRIVLSLKNKGVLERCGAKKNGKWKILM